MRYEAILLLPPDVAGDLQDLLDRDAPVADTKFDGVLWQDTVRFPDGCEADLKIVNGDTGPWHEVVLFDAGGCEAACSEVLDSLLGETTLFHGDDAYLIEVAER